MNAEPQGLRITPTQTKVRQRSGKWALVALVLLTASIVTGLFGQWMAAWSLILFMALAGMKSDRLSGWADGYSAGVLQGAARAGADLHAEAYAAGWKDARDAR